MNDALLTNCEWRQLRPCVSISTQLMALTPVLKRLRAKLHGDRIEGRTCQYWFVSTTLAHSPSPWPRPHTVHRVVPFAYIPSPPENFCLRVQTSALCVQLLWWRATVWKLSCVFFSVMNVLVAERSWNSVDLRWEKCLGCVECKTSCSVSVISSHSWSTHPPRMHL